MFLKFREKHCPVCGILGIEKGGCYKCSNCETIFSDFGILKEPLNGTMDVKNITDIKDIFEDN